MSISSEDGKMVWRFPLEAVSGRLKLSRVELAHVFMAMPNLDSFSLEPVRH
jgi:hypothetical protein